MPRFVILEHDWPSRHWDLLLETGGVLRAWRLLSEPVVGSIVPAEPNYDHRLLYLDYEGPLSGDRGSVSRCASGEFDWIEDGPTRVVLRVTSNWVIGTVTIERCDVGSWVCTVN